MADHDAKYWAWKYERREAECEELASRLREALAIIAECDSGLVSYREMPVVTRDRIQAFLKAEDA